MIKRAASILLLLATAPAVLVGCSDDEKPKADTSAVVKPFDRVAVAGWRNELEAITGVDPGPDAMPQLYELTAESCRYSNATLLATLKDAGEQPIPSGENNRKTTRVGFQHVCPSQVERLDEVLAALAAE